MTSSIRIFPLAAALLIGVAFAFTGCGLNRKPPPRYNTVLGGKHAPVLNPDGQGVSGLNVASAPPYPAPPGPPPYPAPEGGLIENTVPVGPAPPLQRGDRRRLVGQEESGSLRRLPIGNRQELAVSEITEPPVMEAAEPVTELSADWVAPPGGYNAVPAPPRAMDGRGYPILAETPSAPEDADARLGEAQDELSDLLAAREAAYGNRAMQESFSGAGAAGVPASPWRPVQESAFTGVRSPSAPPSLLEAAPPPPPARGSYAPVASAPRSGPVEVVRDVPASAVAPERGLPPVRLAPPPSNRAAPTVGAYGGEAYRYIAPSRYKYRREVPTSNPLQQP